MCQKEKIPHAESCEEHRSTGGVPCRQILAWDNEMLSVIAVGGLQVKDCLRKINPYKQRVEEKECTGLISLA